jgi:hypothetical protein
VSIERVRRYYLLKRREAARQGDLGLASVWMAKQLAEPGIVLASDFPYRMLLVAVGYSTVEDVDGATTEELQQAGLTQREAAAVLAAI